MSSPKRKIRFGVMGSGYAGPVGWREPDAYADGAVNIDAYAQVALKAEEGLFDFMFIADSAYITKESIPYFLSRLEPATALAALAVLTKRIGLVGTFTTSFSEPFTTARQLASLDQISRGRAGWNAVTSAIEGLGRNHSHARIHPHALRYEIANEYVDVLKGLWDSWEDDAFPRNKATGEYVKLDKLHTLNHKGKFFSVEGPLNLERSRQGRPVVFQAGASEPGIDLAARTADAVYSRHSDLKRGGEYARALRERTAHYGREPRSVLIFPTITTIVAQSKEEAEQKYQSILAETDINYALQVLSRFFSFYPFKDLPLDEPVPELGDIGKDSFKATAELFLQMAKEEKLTVRQLALRVATPKGDYVGSPVEVADKVQASFETGLFDGFIIGKESLDDFVQHIVPILQERGLYRTEYESDTLRGNLGLEYPTNRYVAAREQQVA